MKKKIFILLLSTLIILFILFLILRNRENREYIQKGNIIIEKIENYKLKNGIYPNSLSDIHVDETMGEGPYYEKIDSISYILYYNIGFDNSFVYNSNTKEWEDKP